MTAPRSVPSGELGSLFTGQLVRLTAKQTGDNAAIVRWQDDAEYARLYGFYDAVRPYSQAELDRDDLEARENADSTGNDGSFDFMFRTLADDKLIGSGHLWVAYTHQIAWVGIGIGEAEYRSKGYGTDAMRLLLGYAFRELGLYRVELEVLATNPRAIRSYQKAGFQHESTERSAVYRDGQRIDILIMGILRPEWEALNPSFAAGSVSDLVETDQVETDC